MKRILCGIISVVMLVTVLVSFLSVEAVAAENYMWPVPSTTKLSQGYTGIGAHDAIDIAAGKGSTIVATKSGKVVMVYAGCNNESAFKTGKSCSSSTCSPNAGYYSYSSPSVNVCNYGYGRGVVIQHSDGSGYSFYAHMSSVAVNNGSTVKQGDKIGEAGTYGASTGPHLHFSISEGGCVHSGNWWGPGKYSINNNPSTISYIYSGVSISANVEREDSNVLGKYSVENTNAVLPGKITVIGGTNKLISQTGCYLYNSSGTLVGKIVESSVGVWSGSKDYGSILYNVNNELKVALTPGTTYKYKLYANVNGVDYYSPEYTFTTTGNAPHTHSYTSDWVSDTNNHWYQCSCGEKNSVAPHAWNSGVITTAATENATGVKTYTCTTCKKTKTETIPKLPHTHKYGSTWTSDSNNHWQVCSCGEKGNISAHTWNSGEVTKPATETSTGIKTYTCTICKKTKDEAIPKLTPSTGAKIVVGNVTGKPGSTVDLTVTLSGTPKINFIVLYDILYDRSKVELISAKWIQKGVDDADYDIGENIMHRDLGSEVVDLNGSVAKITLKIKENIDNCETSVSLKCAAVTLDSRYDIDAFAGTVSILNVIRGDFDNDGELSAVDAIYLKKHIALPSRYPLNQNGDLDGDGRVTAKDALYLKKHIALPSRYPLH